MLLQLRISMLIGIVIYFFILFYFLKKKMLSLKYTLLWMFFGLVLLLVVLFPILLNAVYFLGIKSPVNGIFVISFFAVLTILMSLTAIVSKMSARIKTLAQYNAELELRVRELEKIVREQTRR